MKIVTVAAARPNFMKVAPFIRAIENYNRRQASGGACTGSHWSAL